MEGYNDPVLCYKLLHMSARPLVRSKWGYEVFAPRDMFVNAKSSAYVKLAVKVKFDSDTLRARLITRHPSPRHGLILSDGGGFIEPNVELMALFINHSDSPFLIRSGRLIGTVVFEKNYVPRQIFQLQSDWEIQNKVHSIVSPSPPDLLDGLASLPPPPSKDGGDLTCC